MSQCLKQGHFNIVLAIKTRHTYTSVLYRQTPNTYIQLPGGGLGGRVRRAKGEGASLATSQHSVHEDSPHQKVVHESNLC